MRFTIPNQIKTIVKNLVDLLNKKELTIAFAESVTSGFLPFVFSITPDSGSSLLGSIVCYNVKIKKQLMQVPDGMIDKFTAESKEVTAELLKQLKKMFKPDIAVAVTGLASIGGSDDPLNKPVGTIFVAIKYNKTIHSSRFIVSGPPEIIVAKATLKIVEKIEHIIK